MKILMIDDEVEILEICEYVFQMEGHEVTTLSNPSKCMSVLENDTFDIIISDHKMPGQTGTDLFYALKDVFKDDLPAFYLSTGDYNLDFDKLKADGMTDVLMKPYDVDTLVEHIIHGRQNVA